MHLIYVCLVLWSSSAEDGSIVTASTLAAKAGALLPVQRGCTYITHVHVRLAGTLDGLCLVRHWPQRDREQQPWFLGHW